jgi:hypothetical protein
MINVLKTLPVIISFLLLSAHFYRAGLVIPAGISIAIPMFLLIRKSWVPRLLQILLLLGALEWLRSLILFTGLRIEIGQPWTRLAIILGAVALFTALSSLVFRSESIRSRYTARQPRGEPRVEG